MDAGLCSLARWHRTAVDVMGIQTLQAGQCVGRLLECVIIQPSSIMLCLLLQENTFYSQRLLSVNKGRRP